jgi:hypothetical protein
MAPTTRPNQISDWKKLFLNQAPQLFEKPNLLQPPQSETDSVPLHAQIGRLQMELIFLKKTGPPERLAP